MVADVNEYVTYSIRHNFDADEMSTEEFKALAGRESGSYRTRSGALNELNNLKREYIKTLKLYNAWAETELDRYNRNPERYQPHWYGIEDLKGAETIDDLVEIFDQLKSDIETILDNLALTIYRHKVTTEIEDIVIP